MSEISQKESVYTGPSLSQGFGTAVATASTVPAPTRTISPELALKTARGAGWFMTIFLLSLINTALSIMHAQVRFVLGLGLTSIVDHLAKSGAIGYVPAIAFNALASGMFFVFHRFAKERQEWAFIIGTMVFAGDAVLTFMVQDWISLAFHVYALVYIVRGWMAVRHMSQAV
jgi:hypothetical protein